ncbi:MAG TPA: NADH-quinone oxidoreductase subunit N [Nitrospiria bacterium]|nr:NADH-quinone oxidoreductase subunit N [Nitrospiria bacterium]
MAILPETVITLFACVVLLMEPFTPKEQRYHFGYFAIGGLIAAAISSFMILNRGSVYAFGGMFILDPFSTFFKYIIYIGSAITILISMRYLDEEDIHLGEYYAFILLATAGMMIMVSAGDLIMVYLGLETMSISLYVMAGFKRFEGKSIEAAAKYFVLGSFSSGILLFGISLLFGMTGSTNLMEIENFIKAGALAGTLISPGFLLAVIFLVVGLAFKVSAVPFHMWTPDVYEGSPTAVTAFMAAGPKAASMAVFLRVFLESLGGIKAEWTTLLIVLAILTMAVGNILAIVQTNIKRMLAYSSIAHAGYALIGLIAGGPDGTYSLMMYMLIYTVMNMGAFGVIILLHKGGFHGEEITDLTGLGKKYPFAAFMMLVFMFSLTGLPPTAGFIGKFYIFMSAVHHNLTWLAVIGVLLSAISAYYYLKVVMVMYMKETDREYLLATGPGISTALVAALIFILAVGVYPAPLIALAQAAVQMAGPLP